MQSQMPLITAVQRSNEHGAVPSHHPTSEGEAESTCSEGVEPLTPNSDAHTPHFHHRDNIADHTEAAMSPEESSTVGSLHVKWRGMTPKHGKSSSEAQSTQGHTEEVDPLDKESEDLSRRQPEAVSSLAVAQEVTSDRPSETGQSEAKPPTLMPRSTSSVHIQIVENQAARRKSEAYTKTSEKELPSLYDVPERLRKNSPTRGRRDPNGRLDAPHLESIHTARRPSPFPRPPRTPNAPSPPPIETRPTIIKRANTFLGKLKRTPSHRVDASSPGTQDIRQYAFDASKPISATNRRPTLPISQSARYSHGTSSFTLRPGSSHLQEGAAELSDDNPLTRITTTGGTSHDQPMSANSKSATALSGMGNARQGVTFAGSTHARGRTSYRNRSASSGHIPTLAIGVAGDEEESDVPRPAQLFATFSKHAAEGAGLKARRLSTNLPANYQVDYCELSKEFKASKLFARRGKLIGKGATAEVTVMMRRDLPNALVAVKEFRGRDKDETEFEYSQKIKSEYTIAKSLHHPNVVETVRLCTHSGRWNHVMEYCEVGDLYSLLERGLFKPQAQGGVYKAEDKLCFFKQILRAVAYLHDHGIAHRDIKTENILMTNRGHLKLTDFGVSDVFSGDHPGLRTAGGECGKNMTGEIRRCRPGICGSLPYIAPEVLTRNTDYDPRPLDVWSCAIVYIVMAFSGPPWTAASGAQEAFRRFQLGWARWHEEKGIDAEPSTDAGGMPRCGQLFAHIEPPAVRRVILKMMHPNPARRCTVAEALARPVIRGAACCAPDPAEDAAAKGGKDACCGGIDASKAKYGLTAVDGSAGGSDGGLVRATVLPKHSHLPPRDHRTPKSLQHRFDMGDGWS